MPWLGLSAFMLSLVMALISAYYALRGPEIVARPLEELLVYRDGEGANAVAVLGLRLQLINTASSEYGDLLMEAEARLGDNGAWYPIQSEIEPVFTAERPDCALGSRCHYLSNLVVIERGVDIIDIPGGAARSFFVTFALSPTVCDGKPADCQAIADFTSGARRLSQGRQSVTIKLKFNGDGERRLHCTFDAMDPDFLRSYGWQSVACEDSSVFGGKFL